MKVRHEDLVYYLCVTGASIIALLFSLAVFSTPNWGIGGKLAMFALVLALWCAVFIPLTIFYFEERDKRVAEERQRWEAQEQRRLERARLESPPNDESPVGTASSHHRFPK